jgi:hypothetical protein
MAGFDLALIDAKKNPGIWEARLPNREASLPATQVKGLIAGFILTR